MHGGDIIAGVLEAQGTRFLFTLCGGHISPILVGCKARGIRVVDTRHEATAVFAADAVARLTGRPGVAAVTAGPGLTNTITAVKNAQIAQSPIVLLGGAAPTMLKGRGALQDIDQMALLRPHVKWARAVRRVRDLAPAVEQAFAEALHGVPGPVFVECPIDLLYDEPTVRKWYVGASRGRSIADRALKAYLSWHARRLFAGANRSTISREIAPTAPEPDAGKVGEVAGRLRQAERPLLLIGSQALCDAGTAPDVARAVERLGATIYEQTEVTDYTTGAYPVLHTARGHVRAKTIVLCGESYLSRLPKIGRNLIPVYSLITLTEPLSDADWAEIGWRNRECVASCRYTVDYLSRTADGRILFGGRGAPYRFGSKITPEMDKHAGTHQMLQDNVRAWFPRLKDVRFTHTWGGPLGWSRDFMPTVSFDREQGLGMAHGYTGNGVSTTNLTGRMLADMITDQKSVLLELPHANHKTRQWEPEPFRFLGVRFVQQSFMRIDRKSEETGLPPNGKSIAERLTAH